MKEIIFIGRKYSARQNPNIWRNREAIGKGKENRRIIGRQLLVNFFSLTMFTSS